jgi:hypothetical protein
MTRIPEHSLLHCTTRTIRLSARTTSSGFPPRGRPINKTLQTAGAPGPPPADFSPETLRPRLDLGPRRGVFDGLRESGRVVRGEPSVPSTPNSGTVSRRRGSTIRGFTAQRRGVWSGVVASSFFSAPSPARAFKMGVDLTVLLLIRCVIMSNSILAKTTHHWYWAVFKSTDSLSQILNDTDCFDF